MRLTFEQAQAMIAAAIAEARARAAKPLGIIVLDAGGCPVAYARQDGASLFRFDIARAKAMGALGMDDDTRAVATRAAGNPAFFNSVAAAVPGGMVLSAAGVVARGGAEIFGAIGISGDAADADGACALAGIAAASLDHRGAAP